MTYRSVIGAFIIPLCLLTALVTGCDKSEDVPRTNTEKQRPTIIIGLIPERNIFEQMQRYDPLAKYLSEKTGVNIKLKVLTRYGNIIDNFVSTKLDGAFFGSFTYALAHAKLGVEPLARPENLDGTSTYYGMIFVRKDSGIKNARDMKGKVFAFVDKATTAGHLLPLAYFRENGINNYKTYFKETYFTGTHDDAIYDVLNGKADVGAAKNTIFYNLSKKDEKIENELVILKRSPDVPENGLAVRKDLDPAIKSRLREALLNMHNDQEGARVLRYFKAKRFIDTKDADYKGVYDYLKEIELDLKTYDYMND